MEKLSLDELMAPGSEPTPQATGETDGLDDHFRALIDQHVDTEEATQAPDPIDLLLSKLLHAKHSLALTYHLYGDGLACLERDGLHKHFREHAEEEHAAAYQLTRKLVARGTPVELPAVFIESQVDLQKPDTVLKALRTLEEKSVALWTELFQLAANDIPLQGFAQDGAVVDQAHLEDMIRYLGGGK